LSVGADSSSRIGTNKQLNGVLFSMDLVCNLPEAVVLDLFMLWIDITDIGNLDSAMCNRFGRSSVMETLSSAEFVILTTSLSNVNIDKISTKQLDPLNNWLFKRQIATSHIVITNTFVSNHSARHTYLQCNGQHVRKLSLDNNIQTAYGNYDSMLSDLWSYCPHVVAVHCWFEFPAGVQVQIATHWPALTHLTLNVQTVGVNELTAIGSVCQSLVEVCLLCSEPVTPFFQVCSPKLQRILGGGPLGLLDCVAIASRCPFLRTLNKSFGDIDDNCLAVLSKGCPCLDTLDLTFNRTATNVGLGIAALNGALITLTVVAFANLTDAGMIVVAECCHLLENVDITDCPQLTDLTLVALGQHCHNLRVLTMFDTFMTHNGLIALAAGCPRLEQLHAFHCRMIGLGIEALALGCPRLRQLSAENAETPAEAVLALARHCPLLEWVGLSGEEIGDSHITELAMRCPELTGIAIAGTSVEEPGLRAIAQYCKKLKKIEVSELIGPDGKLEDGFFPAGVEVTYEHPRDML
jgi:hypothetical protein